MMHNRSENGRGARDALRAHQLIFIYIDIYRDIFVTERSSASTFTEGSNPEQRSGTFLPGMI
jgi:hypothetical protein